MNAIVQNLDNVRKTGQTTISTVATPLTKVGDTSSGNTTYTATTVTDGTAWDLSKISEGDVALSEDGYKGLITEVDDGNDILTVGPGWTAPDGKQGRLGGNVKPTDGQTLTIIRIDHCLNITIKALPANTAVLRVGTNGTAVADDYHLSAGRRFCQSRNNKKPVDVSRVYVLAESGSQAIAWIVGGATLGGI
jgi:hypothetical protein